MNEVHTVYRLTPRQVVVIVPRSPTDPKLSALARDIGPTRLDDLLLATLRDAIAAAVRVDGATIAVVAPTHGHLAHLRQLLPAGVEFAAPPEPLGAARLARFALTSFQGRDYERLMIIDSAVLHLTSRLVGTGLGALASADAIVGGSRRGATYAFGLLERHVGRFPQSDEPLINGDQLATEFVGQLRAMRLGTRRLDPLPTLDAFSSLNDLESAVLGVPGSHHLSAFLTSLPLTQPALSDLGRHIQ